MPNKTPWQRVLIEGALIVGSILLAFGIQAGWDERNERRAVQTAVDDVILEVEVGRREISQAIETNLSRVALFEEFLALTVSQLEALPEDSLEIGRAHV